MDTLTMPLRSESSVSVYSILLSVYVIAGTDFFICMQLVCTPFAELYDNLCPLIMSSHITN
jgi:hypothetical protein